MSLSQQIIQLTRQFNQKERRIENCKIVKYTGNHIFKYIGYIYGKIDIKGTIGIISIHRCSCGFEKQTIITAEKCPTNKQLNKLYK